MQYTELHCHSSFSLLDGASTPEELVTRAKELGYSALALTDHNDLGGIVRFAKTAKEEELDALIGTEITMSDNSHLTLLVQDIQGYKNLCHLITTARMSCPRGKPAITFDDLAAHSSGLIALSGCPHGKIPLLIASGQPDKARKQAEAMQDVFGENFFLEMWDHHLHQEALINKYLLEIAALQSLPSVVTNNVHYALPAKRIIHDVLTCLKHKTTLQTAGRRLRPNGSWYLKSPEQMAYLWHHHPEGLTNTQLVRERCQFRLGLLKPSLPNFPLPPEETAITADNLLARLVFEGAKKRYSHIGEKETQQIHHELDMITRLQLSSYFLIMWDIVRFAQSQGIAVQGRGSAANSCVCYCLGITAVDPVGMNLLFERFLSEGRSEPPDIDLDIAHQEREKVIQYVYDKYGREHAAMVSETITYRGRSAVRDTARVLGFSAWQQDKLASEAHNEAIDTALALAQGGAERAGLDPKDRLVRLLIQVVAGLQELPRHRSIHVGGFVLSGEPLYQMVPIEPSSMEGRTIIQWDKDDLDPVGMIKIDLLGLGMLTMIQEALKLIKQHRGIDVDLAHLNMNDPAIYEMLCKADTVGVFQVESRAQMNILPRLRPQCFYDIVVSIALVRPGPIQGNIVHPYIRRRLGQEPVTYLHPSLVPILQRTLGVPLFQEQGMRLAVVAAGFSCAQADYLRRAMSHKRSHEKMAKLCEELSCGMKKNGFSPDAVATITHQLQAFASYGFPESHAASFGLLVYASAYLKKYFAPEFYCALLNAQPMGFYSPSTIVRDAIRHGIKVLSVDLARSSWDCTLESGTLRIGMRFVQGLGRKSQATLEHAWRKGGRFKSIEDVVMRSGLGPKALHVLAKAGAFDSMCSDRRQALWKVLALAKSIQREQTLPISLAKDKQYTCRTTEESPVESTAIQPMSPVEKTIADYQTLGLTAGPHPMTYWRSFASQHAILSCHQVATTNDGTIITVAGGVICRQRPTTAKGVVFITLEDETGMANVVVWPGVFENYRNTILSASFLAITGCLQQQEGVANIIAEHIEKLPDLLNKESIFFHSRDFQ